MNKGPQQKYSFVRSILNEGEESYLPDIAFHPDGSFFGVTHKSNELRIYDSKSYELKRIFQNPAAQFDSPHGLVFSEHHMIVSNKLDPPGRPAILNVYRFENTSDEPVFAVQTPVEYLQEAHSMSIHDRRLLVTYCGGGGANALVSYDFNDETGEIAGPIDMHFSFFGKHGEPKGVCFTQDGTKVVVTFVTEEKFSKDTTVLMFHKLRKMTRSRIGMKRLFRLVMAKGHKLIANDEGRTPNGLALFPVDKRGRIASKPEQVWLNSKYCRFENVNVSGDVCTVADPLNDEVYFYRYQGGRLCDNPDLLTTDQLSFPHDVCISPDGRTLVVANNGITVANKQVQWGQFVEPRGDKVSIYRSA